MLSHRLSRPPLEIAPWPISFSSFLRSISQSYWSSRQNCSTKQRASEAHYDAWKFEERDLPFAAGFGAIGKVEIVVKGDVGRVGRYRRLVGSRRWAFDKFLLAISLKVKERRWGAGLVCA